MYLETGSLFPPESLPYTSDDLISAKDGAFAKIDNDPQLCKMFLEYS
jgi:hypothetical protein